MQDLVTTYQFFIEHLCSMELAQFLLFLALSASLVLPCYFLVKFVSWIIKRISDNYNN